MSKERAVRRAERERVAALRTAEQQAERERRRRRTARRARLTRWLPRPAASPSGIIAERRRGRIRMVVAGLLLVQVLVWIVRDDWPSRLAALLVALLLLPLLLAFTA